MTLLISLDQLSFLGLNFNCTYECFSSQSPIRSPEEIIAITRGVLPHRTILSEFLRFFGAVSIWCSVLGSSYGEEIMRQLDRRACGLKYLSPQYFLPLGGAILIVICERNILRGLPQGEKMHAVGQWAPIVGAIFILLAVLFDQYLSDSWWAFVVRSCRKAKRICVRNLGRLRGVISRSRGKNQGTGLLREESSVELVSSPREDIDGESIGNEVINNNVSWVEPLRQVDGDLETGNRRRESI